MLPSLYRLNSIPAQVLAVPKLVVWQMTPTPSSSSAIVIVMFFPDRFLSVSHDLELPLVG